MSQDFEKLGVLYLGRRYEPAKGAATEDLVLYDSRDLVTHALCIGMTGSGKTGLGITLLEEALIDGIPVVAIDPKGDIANLLLTFPQLQGAEFLPWVSAEEARRCNVTPDVYAGQEAERWRAGLAAWGEDADRVSRLKTSADFAIYTPGSAAGLPVSILSSFAAPPQALVEEGEWLRDRVTTAVTSILSLMGIEADPLTSREHILLSLILEAAWRQGRNLTLVDLIQEIQKPPVSRIGAFELESFFPAPERFELALSLNGLVASPGFASWLEGEALDVDRMLFTAQGRPRASVFSIAHLGEKERMFFVSLLLGQVLSWMRSQPGTTSLRAVLYMDEIAGYFPPVANPPAKRPLLTLLKQARAYGLGVVLATQNPVDLDYKGLGNIGTWFIGRLQTERDKARVMAGLESAGAFAGIEQSSLDSLISNLPGRVFLMRNVHEQRLECFETRWALSYLRGPLTRDQIRRLMAERKQERPSAAAGGDAAGDGGLPTAAGTTGGAGLRSEPPVLPPGIVQLFLQAQAAESGSKIVFHPYVLASATVHFADAKLAVDLCRQETLAAPLGDGMVGPDWESAIPGSFPATMLSEVPAHKALFRPLPAAASLPKSYVAWSKAFINQLYAGARVRLYRSASLKEVSRPGEGEREFRIRLQQKARELRDAQADKLRSRYAPRIAALEQRLWNARQAVERESEEARERDVHSAISVGATLLGAFMGRKPFGSTSLGRAATAARGMTRSMRQRQDLARARENVEQVAGKLEQLNADFRKELEDLSASCETAAAQLEESSVKPKKSDIIVERMALLWLPFHEEEATGVRPAWSS